MTSCVDRIMVDFAGDGAGEGELTWGQWENWDRIVRERIWAPVGGVEPLPPGTTVTDVADVVRYLMSRHQALRTRIRIADDGRPRQVVFESGEIPLDIVDTDDPDAVAERYRNTPMDFTAEWPLRVAVIHRAGRPTHTVTLVSHLATDGAGIVLMMAELATFDTSPIEGLTPLQQAAWQRSPAGRRHNDAAMRYWANIFSTMAPNRFRTDHDEHSPRYWHGEFHSPALLSAATAITAKTGLGASTVFLTLFAVALHDVTRINPVVLRPIVGNRFRPGLSGVVCTAAQAGICVLDVAGRPFEDAARQVRRSVINAYKYAYYDHEQMLELLARIERERGLPLDTRCFVNDRHGVAPTGTLFDTTVPPGRFRWVGSQDDPPVERLFVEIDDLPDAIGVTLHLDTRAIPLADAESVAVGMERIAVEAATWA